MRTRVEVDYEIAAAGVTWRACTRAVKVWVELVKSGSEGQASCGDRAHVCVFVIARGVVEC